jgi:hypothetical protein
VAAGPASGRPPLHTPPPLHSSVSSRPPRPVLQFTHDYNAAHLELFMLLSALHGGLPDVSCTHFGEAQRTHARECERSEKIMVLCDVHFQFVDIWRCAGAGIGRAGSSTHHGCDAVTETGAWRCWMFRTVHQSCPQPISSLQLDWESIANGSEGGLALVFDH